MSQRSTCIFAGLDEFLADIRDLIDRARHPEAYAELCLGNEMIIAGPPLSGKKSLAEHIAKDAKFDRIIIVHNPRNADAMRARQAYGAARAQQKTLLRCPRLDLIGNAGIRGISRRARCGYRNRQRI